MIRRALVALALIAASCANASALPGQTTAQFLSWAKSAIPVKLQTSTNEMSGGTAYHALFHVGPNGRNVIFSAEPAGGTILHETIALQGVGDMETYDIRGHKNIVHQVLAWIYGANVASDFSDAKLVADYKLYQEPTHQAIYRGKLYGYQLSGIAVDVMRLQDVDEAAKEAKRCSTMECGD